MMSVQHFFKKAVDRCFCTRLKARYLRRIADAALSQALRPAGYRSTLTRTPFRFLYHFIMVIRCMGTRAGPQAEPRSERA